MAMLYDPDAGHADRLTIDADTSPSSSNTTRRHRSPRINVATSPGRLTDSLSYAIIGPPGRLPRRSRRPICPFRSFTEEFADAGLHPQHGPYQRQTIQVVGTRPVRHDGADKVTGLARYSADLNLPGMLYGKVLRSPHAHARIKSIDTSKAEAMPGVRAVVTGRRHRGTHRPRVRPGGRRDD